MRKFNVTGVCVPTKHYMVDISGKLEQIMKLINDGCYFTINRARQYGKTTTLSMIQRTLSPEYICIRISFQNTSKLDFETEQAFCQMLLEKISISLKGASVPSEYKNNWFDKNISNLRLLDKHITKMCKSQKVVLMIDEFDKISNFLIPLNFLSILREKFLLRTEDMDYTFHSVVLAGVYDIDSLKQKMITEGLYAPSEMESVVRISPWNIAVNFTVDMSFNQLEIKTMLEEYEADHNTGMDIAAVSEEIYIYTSGYPFMVSKICQLIDEERHKNWTEIGVRSAVRMLLEEKNMLFNDVFKNLQNDKSLSKYIYELLVLGEFKPYVSYNAIVSVGERYGFLRKQSNGRDRVAISNKIFELLMTDYFISEDLGDSRRITGVLHVDVIRDGRFDMELCLRKFAEHYSEIFNESDVEFLERHGRLLFLSYLRPLINGQGFYHIESQFTDLRRMDIVVDFGYRQFIIELKLWRGQQYQMEAYMQLCGYLESKHVDTGYLLTFDFRSEGNRVHKAEWLEVDGKRIFDVMV